MYKRQVYERCLPLATRDLKIDATRAGPNAAILGAGSLLRDVVLSGGWVDEATARA